MDRNDQRYVLSIKNGIQKHFKTSLSSEAKKQYLRRYIYAYLCIFLFIQNSLKSYYCSKLKAQQLFSKKFSKRHKPQS